MKLPVKLISACVAVFIPACFSVFSLPAEDGSRLWLRYGQDGSRDLASVRLVAPRHNSTMLIAVEELRNGWKGAPVELRLVSSRKARDIAPEGFRIRTERDSGITLEATSGTGLLYGAYHLLRLQETGAGLDSLDILQAPAFNLRILNHWDNLDGTVERGYAGSSIWKWDELPPTSSVGMYVQYGRANASIGINGTVLNNVNASPQILSSEYLAKVKSIADILRAYGIRVYLSVNFASPMVLSGLPDADPANVQVQTWWKDKADEIYSLIPDFGGFLVKANSEGQPGPCDYGRTHAEGANCLAEALAPHGGIVMWRAFVYSPTDSDRAKQAYLEFQPLDGEFMDNVIVQVKNGPVDFQPREPYSPLFGAMSHTGTMVEFQITQEYLGHSNHLAYLAPMWKEFYNFVSPESLKAVAGVANIGDDRNWCGSHFAQANWYAFGRLAWDPALSSEEIAGEWLRMTFSQDSAFVSGVTDMMMRSREAVVDYMMPMGLHHLFAWGHHYGPEPWCDIEGARPDWMPSYYHKADSLGLGFDRSEDGSGAVLQYPDSLARVYGSMETCPEEYLLWFHHVPWDHVMPDGRTMWDELCLHYDRGVAEARDFQRIWDSFEDCVDAERFAQEQSRLRMQARDAQWWKDACLLYFQTFSGLPIPQDVERPVHDLDAMKAFRLDISNYECAPHGFCL